MRYTLDGMLPEKAFTKKLLGNSPATLEGGGGNQQQASSQPSSQTITANPIADWAQPTATALIGSSMQNAFNIDSNGNILGSRGFTPFGGATNAQGQFTGAPISQDQYNQQLAVAGLGVAGPSALQQQSYQGAQNLQMPGQFGAATGAAGMGTMEALTAGNRYNQMATDPNAQQAFMSPYIQNALTPQLEEMQRQYGITGTQEASQATQQGAFGGGRDAIMQAENQRNKNMAMNQAIGQGYQNAFTAAQQAQQYGANLGLQGAQAGIQGAGQLAGIGGQQLAAQQGILGTQNQMGMQQQQNQQNIINQAIQNYSNQQQYPQQQAANIMNLLRSTPTTQTQTQYAAPPSAVSQIAGLGTAGLAASKLMAGGGIAKVKKFDVGGEVENDLYKMPTDALTNEVKITPSKTIKDTGNAILKERAMGTQPPQNFAPGGIVAFADGGDTTDDDEEEDDIPMMGNPMGEAYLPSMITRGVPTNKQAPAQPVSDIPKHKFYDLIKSTANDMGVDVNAALKLAHKETGNLNTPEKAVSRAGAQGVLQIMPKTGQSLGLKDPFNPEENVQKGLEYFKKLYQKYGDYKTAAIAYNWGPGNTDKWIKSGRDMNALPAETYKYQMSFAQGGVAEARKSGLAAIEKMPSMPEGYKGSLMDFLNSPEGREYIKAKSIAKNAIIANTPLPDIDKMNLGPNSYKTIPQKGIPQVDSTLPDYTNDVPYSPTAASQPVVNKPQFNPAVNQAVKPSSGIASGLPDYTNDVPYSPNAASQPLEQASEAPEPQKQEPAKMSSRELLESYLMDKWNKQGEEADKDKWMSLLSAGLGMMSGTSPYAAANIGQGAQQGIAAHMMARKNQQLQQNALLSGMLGLEKQKGLENYYKSMSDDRKLALIQQAQISNARIAAELRGQDLSAQDRQDRLDEIRRNNDLIAQARSDALSERKEARTDLNRRSAIDDLRMMEDSYKKSLESQFIKQNPMWHMDPKMKSAYDVELQKFYNSPQYQDQRKQAYPNVDFSVPQIKTDNVIRFDNKGNPVK